MSTSLKVVRIAACCWALTNCAAILRRSGDIRLRVERGLVTHRRGRRPGRQRRRRGFDFRSRAATPAGTTSAVWDLPPPEWRGCCCFGFLFSQLEPPGQGPRRGGVLSSMVPTTAPISTSSPSLTAMWSTPSQAASSSVEILSVSMVRMTSPASTTAPSGLCQGQVCRGDGFADRGDDNMCQESGREKCYTLKAISTEAGLLPLVDGLGPDRGTGSGIASGIEDRCCDIFSRRGAMKAQAPMFIGSSWHQTHFFLASGYRARFRSAGRRERDRSARSG